MKKASLLPSLPTTHRGITYAAKKKTWRRRRRRHQRSWEGGRHPSKGLRSKVSVEEEEETSLENCCCCIRYIPKGGGGSGSPSEGGKKEVCVPSPKYIPLLPPPQTGRGERGTFPPPLGEKRVASRSNLDTHSNTAHNAFSKVHSSI